MKIRANGIELEVEDSGEAPRGEKGRPVVLLIMGLGLQLVAWPEAMVQSLVDAGHRVVRYDNRDVGLSQKLDHLGQPKLLWESLKLRLGLPIKSPYRLHDMAQDALGVLDALGIARAHVVGLSMGGMIAQRVALAAPERVLSLACIMSSSGARGLPQAEPQVMRILLGKPAGKDTASVVAHFVRLFKAIGSPDFPTDTAQLRQQVRASVARSHHPAGTMRQMLAVVADGQRAAQLHQISAPTLVIHGKADPLLPFACGEDIARRIPHAQLLGIDGMGHDLPAALMEHLLPPLLQHFTATQARTA